MAAVVPEFLEQVQPWPFAQVLIRIVMAMAVGIMVGLEREHSQKTGVRTFALVALLGCLGGMMGTLFAALATGFFAVVVVAMSYRQMVNQQRLGLTTSMALTVVGFAGILFGAGHVFTPAVAGIATAALLAWKDSIARFAGALTDRELRSAILLAILTIVVLPVLPPHPVDPWGLIEPRENWASVIIVATLGFVNYILMRLLGARGLAITAFFGGLVNSRKVIVELGLRLRQIGAALVPSVHRGILLAMAAMVIRNALIVLLLAPAAVTRCAIPLAVMGTVAGLLWVRARSSALTGAAAAEVPPMALESPFSLTAALEFGLVFLALNVAGALAQRHFGSASFYFVSVAGGLLSSASSIASAATLAAHHDISLSTGATGVVLSSLTSVLANIPLIRGLVKEKPVRSRICGALIAIAASGLVGVGINRLVFALA